MQSKILAQKIRKNILQAILRSQASHIASAMSIVDILAVLYSTWIDPRIFQFILSKGHAGIAVYSTLNALGIINDEIFASYYTNGSYLGGHISHKNVAGVHLSTGSLGGGIAVANGVALANRLNNLERKIYIIVGDGECEEGSIWEAALFAAHHQLQNITVIIDRNHLQGCGSDQEILNLGDLGQKWQSFGWTVLQTDGHDHQNLSNTLAIVSANPKCIIAHTTKGKGASFMENNNLWHYKNINQLDYEQALLELDKI